MNREKYLEETKNEMYKKFKAVHNNEYEYVDYINVDEPFFAICKKHGKFQITANNHLRGKGKCPLCHTNKVFEKYINNKRFYICEIHGDIPIGLTRSLTQGCPECNKINGKIKIENNLKKNIIEGYSSGEEVGLLNQ